MSLDNERPESLLGLIAGLEGVADGYTIIHGPTGCKYYPSSVSESCYRTRKGGTVSRNLFEMGSRYFFSQPRVPCTYLDMGKFVTGGKDRLEDLSTKVEKMGPSVIGIVNSPGASLIGEDIGSVGRGIPTVCIDHADYSGTCSDGFQDAVLALVDRIRPERKTPRKGTVNLVGISILHLNWNDTVEDLRNLLALCGIEINCVIGAGWTAEDIRRSAEAEANILVYPEYGDRVADFYEREYGIQTVRPREGAPIGFDALEDWVISLCQIMKRDPTAALEEIKVCRRRAAGCIRTMESCHLLPKGRTFSLYCDGSTAYAVSRFLYRYLGMIPVAVTCPNGERWKDETFSFFGSKGIPLSDDALHTETDVIIAGGAICSSAISKGTALGHVDIEGPGDKTVNVRAEPAIGLGGTMRLLDGVLNTIADRQRFR